MKKFYGLTGTQLNIAIAVVAGTDFALFGYGKCFSHVTHLPSGSLTLNRPRCYGWSFDLEIIPPILPTD
jgi:hypothetical protein